MLRLLFTNPRLFFNKRRNMRAFRGLEKDLSPEYDGQYAGIVKGKLIGVEPTFEDLLVKLDAVETNPEKRFVFCIGDYYPRRITILFGHQTWPQPDRYRRSITVTFDYRSGSKKATKKLEVDTGAPIDFILDPENMGKLKIADGPDARSNFCYEDGGWVMVDMPELDMSKKYVLAFANVNIGKSTKKEGYDGLAGLRFVRRFHEETVRYVGNDGKIKYEYKLESWEQYEARTGNH
jgi:hypothetical protein